MAVDYILRDSGSDSDPLGNVGVYIVDVHILLMLYVNIQFVLICLLDQYDIFLYNLLHHYNLQRGGLVP